MGVAEEPEALCSQQQWDHCMPLLGELLGKPPLWIVLLRILFQDGTAKVILLEFKYGSLRGL